MGPLNGRRVVVTRPRDQSADLSRRLAALGATVVHAPLIKTVPPASWAPLDAALRALASFDAVVVTSPNGARALAARARRVLGRPPVPPRRLYAVGPGTAKALAAEGWRGARVSKVHEGAALARFIGAAPGERILLARAKVARESLPRILRRAGARVVDAPAYRTVPDAAGRAALRRAADRGADWVTFTSGSTVEGLYSALGPAAARRLLSRARAASIGPVTSAALRARGVEPAAEASPYTPEGLARAMAARSRPVPPAALRAALVAALRAAGRQMLARFGKAKVSYKGRANPVTEADHAAEQAILDEILRRFPDHDFLTEERAPRDSGSDYVWVVDPIDGTLNYAHGFPHSCASVAVLRRGEAVAGGVYDPFRGEMFLAGRGRGATLNGRRIRVAGTRRLRDALLITGFAYDRHERAALYAGFVRDFLGRAADLRRSGSAALDLAWVAAGRLDGFWEFHLNPWDVAAGRLLVEEAGGRVTDFSGRLWGEPRTWGRQTLASNGLIHPGMRAVLRRAAR